MGFLRDLLNKESLTSKLFKLTDDYEIYCTFIGKEVQIGEVFASPIRANDDFPSFAIYIPSRARIEVRPDEIWFKDLATGDSGNIFKFVKLYAFNNYGIILETRDQIIKYIDSELNLGLFTNNEKSCRERLFKTNLEEVYVKELFYKFRPFTNRDKDYWGKLYVNEEDLNFFNIHSVKYLLNPDGSIRKEFKYNELAYIYSIWDKEKLYQPEAPKQFKFRNTCPNDYKYYQGYKQLSLKTEKLIITKSMKDVVLLWKFFNKFLNIPIDVLAPPAESVNFSEEFVNFINNYYKEVLIISDFDLAGVKFANKAKKIGYRYKFMSTNRVNINGKYKVLDKDPSDFLLMHGYDKTLEIFKTFFI